MWSDNPPMISSSSNRGLAPEYAPAGRPIDDADGRLKPRRTLPPWGRLLLCGLALSGAAPAGYFGWTHAKEVRAAWASVVQGPAKAEARPAEPAAVESHARWDGLVPFDGRACEAIGLSTMKVGSQVEP